MQGTCSFEQVWASWISSEGRVGAFCQRRPHSLNPKLEVTQQKDLKQQKSS